MPTHTISLRLTTEEQDILDWIATQQPHLSASDLVRDLVLRDAKRRGVSAALIAAAVASRKEHSPRERRIPFYKGRREEV